MIDRLIEDVERALDANAFMAALSLILTLPDICAKAEYGNTLGNKERYIKWYDSYIGKYEKEPDPPQGIELPYLSGEVVYQLRCSVLHQGTPNVDRTKIKDEQCRVDYFTLVVEKKKPFDIYVDAAGISATSDSNESQTFRHYRMNIRRICQIITLNVKDYYEKHKDKFTFFDYDIIDVDEIAEQINRTNGGM